MARLTPAASALGANSISQAKSQCRKRSKAPQAPASRSLLTAKRKKLRGTTPGALAKEGEALGQGQRNAVVQAEPQQH